MIMHCARSPPSPRITDNTLQVVTNGDWAGPSSVPQPTKPN